MDGPERAPTTARAEDHDGEPGAAASGPEEGKPERAEEAVRDAARHPPRPLRMVARLGLVARGFFYLVLAGLIVSLLLGVRPGSGGNGGGQGRGQGAGQANANGALTQVAQAPVGLGLLVAAAVGFAVFALVRFAGAATDHHHGVLRRLSTAGQALLYVGMAAATTSFLLGSSRATGSEQQQHSTAAKVISLPFGRALLAGVGLLVLAMCAWQLIVAARGEFADTLRTDEMGSIARRLTMVTARIGIPARAVAIVPVGVFLVVAAVRADPGQAKGLDAVLLDLSRSGGGRLLGIIAAAGFAVFAVYSLLEARYRQVTSGA